MMASIIFHSKKSLGLCIVGGGSFMLKLTQQGVQREIFYLIHPKFLGWGTHFS